LAWHHHGNKYKNRYGFPKTEFIFGNGKSYQGRGKYAQDHATNGYYQAVPVIKQKIGPHDSIKIVEKVITHRKRQRPLKESVFPGSHDKNHIKRETGYE
jgi:hypothetical protein